MNRSVMTPAAIIILVSAMRSPGDASEARLTAADAIRAAKPVLGEMVREGRSGLRVFKEVV